MNPAIFLVGGVIFTVYLFLLLLNITYSNSKQREENYPNRVDSMDLDGMGNYSRIPVKKPTKKSKWSSIPSRNRKPNKLLTLNLILGYCTYLFL